MKYKSKEYEKLIYEEKTEVIYQIYNFVTHNSITKDVMVDCIRYLLDTLEEKNIIY